jgi:putative CocE/NonD family hydrolase
VQPLAADTTTIRHGVPVVMPDGARLATDVYLPGGSGRWPAVVVRTPYGRGTRSVGPEVDPVGLTRAGVAAVVQDTRGRHDSEGAFRGPLLDDAADGLVTLRWVAEQPWCNGRLGMAGGSYLTHTQLLCAVHAPPQLKAVAPFMGGSKAAVYLRGGAFGLAAWANWLMLYVESELLRAARPDAAALDEVRALVAAGPLAQLRELLRPGSLLGRLGKPLRALLDHDTFDEYYEEFEMAPQLVGADLAGLHIGGWFDDLLDPVLDIRAALLQGPAASRQRLVIGPWAHGGLHGLFPELSFGAEADARGIDLMGRQVRFFHAALTGDDEALAALPVVQAFVTGENRWRTADAWPPPTRPQPLYLRSDGDAGTREGGGRLGAEPAAEPESADAFRYDPADPLPSTGGRTFFRDMAIHANAGPREQARVERRPDVLVYTGEPLPQPLEVAGELVAVLFASTSAQDTDFTARVADVHPDGRSYVFADGIVRLSLRGGARERRSVRPGEVYELRIALGRLHHVFGAGHRIRLQVSSSDFPRFLPHPNVPYRLGDGELPAGVVAEQRVLHGGAHASALWLPVVRSARA